MPDDFCLEHGYEFMVSPMVWGSIPYCRKCEEAKGTTMDPIKEAMIRDDDGRSTAAQKPVSLSENLDAVTDALRVALIAAEQCCRDRCNYCHGDLAICEGGPKDGCVARDARAVIARAA